MTAQTSATDYTRPASEEVLKRTAEALAAHNFGVEILDDVAAARTRLPELIPDGATVMTSASETLRLSGIEDDITNSERFEALRPRLLSIDRTTHGDEWRRLLASPDVVVGSVAAVTETGSLVVASGSGSQLPSYSGGAGRAIWIVGSQKIVPDLSAAFRRIEEHALPLESERTKKAYGVPSAINRVLILNAEPFPAPRTVLLLRQPIGF